MLPAAHRMRSAADFTETTRRGRRLTCGHVVVYLDSRPAPVADGPAVAGLIVGRAVGGSVQRHRVARRIRAALAPLVADLSPGSRVVVRALAGAAGDPGLADDVTAGIRRLAGRVEAGEP